MYRIEDSEDLAPLTADECERLWDAFEKVEQLAFALASDLYVPVDDRKRLRQACEEYRGLRDEIEMSRMIRAANSSKDLCN